MSDRAGVGPIEVGRYRCRNCHADLSEKDVYRLPAFAALYHPYADDPALPCGPVEAEAIRVAPDDGVTICWSCEELIPAGTGRNKSGWLVHELCETPDGER